MPWGNPVGSHLYRLLESVLAACMKVLRAITGVVFGLWVLFASICGAMVIGTCIALPFCWLPRGKRERYTRTACRLWAKFTLLLMMVRLEVTGDANLGRHDGAIVFANHRSWLDPIVLAATFSAGGLSKRQILYIPFIGMYAYLTGSIFFDRRSLKQRLRARDEVVGLVRSGCRLQVFPEGTRSKTDTVRDKVHLRTARDAWSNDLLVVPCALWGTDRAIPVKERAAWPLQRVRLHICAALRPEDYPDDRAFAHAAWDGVVTHVERLKREDARSGNRTRTP